MANQLPSGRWRARVVNLDGKQVAAHTIIGGETTFQKRWQAERAESEARLALVGKAQLGVTVKDFWTDWTTSTLWLRPSESTNIHNRERTHAFVNKYGARPITSINRVTIVREWLDGGRNVGTLPALRAMFADARKAGLIDANPFAELGFGRGKGRRDLKPPDETVCEKMIAAADLLTPPSFAAYLLTACWTAARPGELDCLQWDDLDTTEGSEIIHIRRQWNVKAKKITEPKHGSVRKIVMLDPVRDRLAVLPRESEWVFTTTRGGHYTPSSRTYHWNRVRCAAGIGNMSLYLATRHYFAWYAFNVLELPSRVVAEQLGHADRGRLIEGVYGHSDEAIARDRIREAYSQSSNVIPIGKRSAA